MEDLDIECKTGYVILAETIEAWGVHVCAGVTGGGIIHFLKHLEPALGLGSSTEGLRMYTLGEYVASFVPLGAFLANGSIGAAIATTGAATQLIICSLSDAKMHDIPAVYLIPLSSGAADGLAPLQDTSVYGSNIIARLRAELPGGVFVLDEPDAIYHMLDLAHAALMNSRPVILVMDPDALSKMVDVPLDHPRAYGTTLRQTATRHFVDVFPRHINGRRVVVMVGEEACRYKGIRSLTTRLCHALRAPIIWSINGANAVARDNPYGYGYIAFGGNDTALSLWNSIGPDDILITLGFSPDEYTMNLKSIRAGETWNFTNLRYSYGRVAGSFQHRVDGEYHEVIGPLNVTLGELVELFEEHPVTDRDISIAPDNLNTREIQKPQAGFVDLAEFYRGLDLRWRPGSVGFDDVCLAYKDRQYISQRPHPNIRFYSMYRGSAMGGAFGLGIGAKLADPASPVFIFTGDGCFRLFGGCLAEASELGLALFILNNQSYAIVEQGLPIILPEVPNARYHARLTNIDFCAIASAQGWREKSLMPDLSNLDEILDKCYEPGAASILINVPVDAAQLVGRNPRVHNL